MHLTRVAWTADELNYGRKFWVRSDEMEGVAELGRAKEEKELSGKHEVVKMADKEKESCLSSPSDGKEAR